MSVSGTVVSFSVDNHTVINCLCLKNVTKDKISPNIWIKNVVEV